jgi:hypothetical protein
MYQPQQIPYGQQSMIQSAQQNYLHHAALADHYERQRMINASNSIEYYRYAELQYFHKSRAFFFKGQFSAIDGQ